MGYLTGEILIYLICVAILGVIVGWLFTRSIYKSQVEEVEAETLAKLRDANKKLESKEEQIEKQQKQLDETTLLLKKEQFRDSFIIDKPDSDVGLSDLEQQLTEEKQKILSLNQTIDEIEQAKVAALANAEMQKEEHFKTERELNVIKNRLTAFDNDLDEIVRRSSLLRTAFDRTRLEVVNKDKRIAELELASNDNLHDGIGMAAIGSSGEPELAISRIARLQDRVQELYEEVSKKDEELEQLRGNITDKTPKPGYNNISDMQKDDLKLIIGVTAAIEERLNQLGVTHFNEVAEWTPSEVKRFEIALDVKDRIESEEWVKQAQKLNLPGGARIHRRW